MAELGSPSVTFLESSDEGFFTLPETAVRKLMMGLFCLVATSQLPAQQLESRPIPSRDIQAYSYQSPSMGRRYDIIVGLPVGYEANPEKKYPALIVTDGNHVFPVANDAARSLMEQQVIEGLFVISIGEPFEEGDSAWTRRRVHEFSPPDWAMTDPFGQLVASGVCQRYRLEPGKCVGGAPQFLDMIVSELVPRLTGKYRIDPNQLGLFGVSAGGFFAAWTIFQKNSPFTKYIISSPAMAYGDGEIFRQEERYAAANKDLKIGIYMASGSLEIDDPFLEGIGRIVSGQAHLGAMLRSRKYPSLKLTSEIHHGLGHGDAAGTTLARGIRVLYGK